MRVSYKKLWKLLIDRDMKKKDLQLASGLSSTTIAKLSNHENVSMEVRYVPLSALISVTLWSWSRIRRTTQNKIAITIKGSEYGDIR